MYHIEFSPMIHTDCFGRFRQLAGRWTGGEAARDWNNLVFILSGECSFNFVEQNRVITVHQGEVILIPLGVYYRASCQCDCEYYFFHFYNPVTEVSEENVRINLRNAEQSVAHQAIVAESRSLFRQPAAVMDYIYLEEVTDVTGIMKDLNVMLSECDIEKRKTDVNRMLRCDLIFSRIVTAVSEITGSRFASTNDFPVTLSKILNYIHENYTTELTLSILSEEFGLSKQHIARLFRQHMRTTAAHYINDLKLSHARELLCHSAMNVSEIAFYLGFSSPNYFSRLFREKYGVHPKEYINATVTSFIPNLAKSK